MNKTLYTVKCLECKKYFRTDDPEQKVCSTCQKFRQPHNVYHALRDTKKPLTFAEISHIAEVYNKINHKYLHYGDVVNLINLHPKQCVCCGARVYKGKHICAKCERG